MHWFKYGMAVVGITGITRIGITGPIGISAYFEAFQSPECRHLGS